MTAMDNFVPSFSEMITEKKEKKPESKAIEDRYNEYAKKIAKKRQELQKIENDDDSEGTKSLRIKIKKAEIEIVESELEIVKLRDKKEKYSKELKKR